MPTVSHRILLPDGTVPALASVRVRLIAVTDPAGMAEGHVAGAYSIGGAIHPQIDGTGTWTAALTENSAITPTGTVYEVVETLSGLPPATVYISVPVGGGHVEDLLAVAPASVPMVPQGPPGIQGPPGPGGLATNPRGAYNSGTTYAANDSAFSNFAWYVSLAGSNTNHDPISSPTWWGKLDSDWGFNILKYGLGVGLGTAAIDTAAMQAAITALPSNGGTLIVPAKLLINSGLALAGRRSVVVRGTGGLSGGAGEAAELQWQGGAATGPLIDARSTYGFVVEDVALTASQAGFDGNLVDLSHNGGGGLDSAYFNFKRCLLRGPTGGVALGLVLLDNAIIGSFDDCSFTDAAVGVVGRTNAGHYSNVIGFKDCSFVRMVTAAAKNAGEAWKFDHCTFQQLVSGNAGAYLDDSGFSSRGLAFVNDCGFYDANTSGTWIDFLGAGLKVLGGVVGGGALGVALHPGDTAIVIAGAIFGGVSAVSINGGWDMVIAGNDVGGCSGTPFVFAGPMPASSVIQRGNGSGVFSTSASLSVGGPVSDASFPGTPPNDIEAFDTVNLQHYRRVAGTWRKSAAYT